MKKILSFLAAGALALGLIGCSGDLHDDEFNPIDTSKFETFELCGAMTDWKNDAGTNLKFTPTENAYEYSVTFTAKDAEQGFCFITKTGLWDDYQIGGESMKAGTLPEGISFSSKAGEGKHEDAIFSGLTKDAAYKMTVETSSGVYVVSLASTEAPVAPAAPVPYVLSGLFIKGAMNGWKDGLKNALMTFTTSMNGEVEYQYDFVGAGGDMEFKVASTNYNDGYSGAEIIVNADYVPFTQMRVGGKVTDLEGNPIPDPGKPGENLGDTGNSTIKATKAGANYRMYIKTNPDKEVFVKVEQIAAVKYKFKVINLGDYAQAWINGSFWGAWELGWPIASWNKAVKDGYAPVAVVDGVAEFPAVFDEDAVAKVGETKSFNFKAIACANDAWGQADWDSGDLACEIEITGDKTFVIVVDAETNEVSIE